MSTTGNQIKLGLITIAAVLLAYFAYNYVMRINQKIGYTVSVHFADARGISKGTPVRRAGADIGWVRSVSLLPEQGIAVAEVAVRPGVTFPRDAIFYIVSEGLIEEKYLAVRNNPNPNPAAGNAQEGDIFEGYPEPAFTDLISNANQALVQVNRLLEVASSFMGKEQLGGVIQELLTELNATVESARSVLERVDSLLGTSSGQVSEVLKNVRNVSKDLTEISAEIKRTVKEVDLPKRLDSVLTQVDTALSLLNQIGRDIASMTSDESFQQDVKGVVHSGKETLDETKETLGVLREVLSTANEKLEKLGGVSVKGKINLRNESTHNGNRSDQAYIDVKTRLSVGDKSLDLGVENVGKETPEDAGVVLQAGTKLNESVLVRGGVFRDEFGLGIDVKSPRGASFSLDAFDLNNPTLNSYISYPLGRRLGLLLGVEDIGDTNQYNAGIQISF